jgi:hypothetical protein
VGHSAGGRGVLRRADAQFLTTSSVLLPTEGLDERWIPAQSSHELRGEFPDQPDRHLVHETISQAIYRPELSGLGAATRPRYCAPGGGAASRTAVRMPAAASHQR